VPDYFDPRRLLDGDDDQDPMGIVSAALADGVMIAEQLVELDSFMGTMHAIGNLDESGVKTALHALVVAYKRAHGMTDEQYAAWVVKDLPMNGG
jgi:hypothetical protein